MYQTTDTIVTIASGPGGAIGIIRISGKDALKISSKFLSPNNFINNPKNSYFLLKITDPKTQKIIDKAIVVIYLSPKSYTGQDMIEIFCHNSPYIIKKTLEIALENGARQAQPGEFTFRAYINGKIDLIQAEAINQLIKAETEKQHSIAIKQAEGSLSKKLFEIKNQIISLLSETEVRIDDSYEEIDEINQDSFKNSLDSVIESIKKLKDTYHSYSYIRDGIKICICGAPNSGKSTLLNTLIGYERIITSPIPGTTRDVIEVILDIKGFKMIFYDTAGIRKTEDPIEIEGIKKTFSTIENSDIILLLKDPLQTEREYLEIKEKVMEKVKKEAKIIEIITKSDILKEKNKSNFLYISSISGENLDKLLSMITDLKEKITDDIYDEIIVSERHYQCLLKSYNELIKIKNIPFNNYELIAEHLKNALNELEAIVGKTLSEDILKNIFSKFCVGK
ncbi:MAG: tRNA uridine-5-carboxymethylaminomethyl(34) synthesis GTPase MnmE [Elusimicrobiales bacterium]|nr:tRNA uridine-5-carboxymethylaminomethyl(34) synthesis GTPase MnmE [Elusimicrobiales bacterium]